MHKRDIQYLLDIILTNAFSHMQAIEREIGTLQLKNDGTDKPEDFKRAQLLTLVLTLMNDTVHPGHDYAYKLFKGYEKEMDRYKQNQKLAFEHKLVNVCQCRTCELNKIIPSK